MPNSSPPRAATERAPFNRQPYHKPHTAIGATGHWVREAGILAPLIISEFVKDPEQRWRYVRIASVATALLSEALWTSRIHRERQERAAQGCPAESRNR
jgi:hypothetical protein